MTDESKKLAGKARWDGVAPETKKALVSKAAHARWKDAHIRIAEYRGELPLGGFKIGCAVLDDGRRILSERAVSLALGHTRMPEEYKQKKLALEAGAEALPVFVPPSVVPYLSPDARKKLANPIRYRNTKGFGIPGLGIEAEILADICEAFLAAREDGQLPPEELDKARAADKLMRALARVAIAALIDEVTGYQVVRDRDELSKLLAKYVSEEHRPWMQKFPDEFYVELFRLRNIKTDDIRRRPQYFGQLTKNIVYSRLLPGILPKLDEVNPTNAKGYRARKHHQHLLAQGEEHLKKHITGVVYLMRSSANWNDFISALDRASPVQEVEAEALPEAP